MQRNIYAYTPPDSPYPEYLSVNENEGRIEVTVRSPCTDGVAEGQTASMALPRSEVEVLRRALQGEMTEEQIKHMADQFLRWSLPADFAPDGGISFDSAGNKGTPHEFARHPSGTNLLDAAQAEAMVRHMIEGLPQG